MTRRTICTVALAVGLVLAPAWLLADTDSTTTSTAARDMSAVAVGPVNPAPTTTTPTTTTTWGPWVPDPNAPDVRLPNPVPLVEVPAGRVVPQECIEALSAIIGSLDDLYATMLDSLAVYREQPSAERADTYLAHDADETAVQVEFARAMAVYCLTGQ